MRPKTLVICHFVSIYVRMSAMSCIFAHLAVPFIPVDTAAYAIWTGVISVVTVRLFTATYNLNGSLYLYNHQWLNGFRRPESSHAPDRHPGNMSSILTFRSLTATISDWYLSVKILKRLKSMGVLWELRLPLIGLSGCLRGMVNHQYHLHNFSQVSLGSVTAEKGTKEAL